MEINIPQRLKDLRDTHKRTQEKVAAGIGVNRKTYQSYEEGRATPPIPVLIKISAFYGYYSLDVLLGMEGVKEQEQTGFVKAYHSADMEKRKIVDFILNLNC